MHSFLKNSFDTHGTAKCTCLDGRVKIKVDGKIYNVLVIDYHTGCLVCYYSTCFGFDFSQLDQSPANKKINTLMQAVKAKCALCCFDLSDPKGLKKLESYLETEPMEECFPDTPKILVGTKYDLFQKVDILDIMKCEKQIPGTQMYFFKYTVITSVTKKCPNTEPQHGLKQVMELAVDLAVAYQDRNCSRYANF